MKKRFFVFFILRMSFYFSVTALILVHPGIPITFDRIGIMQWFIIIPLLALIGFLPESKPFTSSFVVSLRNRFIFALSFLLAFSVFAGGFSAAALQLFFAGLVSFTLAYLLFHHPSWAKLSALEPFFFAWVCLRLLAFSRSGEEAAGASMALTRFILVWTAVVFLFHSFVIYLCLYPNSTKGALKEGAAFLLAAGAVLILVFIVLPPDFIKNSIIENLLSDKVPQRINEDSEKGLPQESGRREGRRTIPRDENGNEPALRGISEYNWQNRAGRSRSGGGSEDNRQYLVKVVASEREPVYMGDAFRGSLDPIEGFLLSQEEPLNRLAGMRLFSTWFDNEYDFDTGRARQEVFSLSTLPQKYLPWKPVLIDPVILSENSGPLRYIHQVVSNTHVGDPLELANEPSRPFSNFEKTSLASYLDIPLYANDIAVFAGWLDNALQSWQENREKLIRSDRYLWSIFAEREANEEEEINLEPFNENLETILAILTFFSNYQYNITYDNEASIEILKDFLFDSAEGDCVVFSNSLALLGRLAGIPSRVVTGYLAAEGLQTNAHTRGLLALRERIPVLQEFPVNNLYMVTNLHAHSWTQFFIPDYGWLDFEATAFALPPSGSGDFNSWDVVIPLIDENRVFSNVRKFPWKAVLRFTVMLSIFALVSAYILRYGREAVLFFAARNGGRAGARSLYLLLLARLAADGKPIKPASKTAVEYSELFGLKDNEKNPHFKNFAGLYSELRWREFRDSAERDKSFMLLKQEYHSIIKTTRQKGLHRTFIRIISLRGLAYL